MTDSPKFILTRHSQTLHNIKKSQIQSQANSSITPDLKYKKSAEYVNFKFNPEFIDRQEINFEQVHSIKHKHNLTQIGLIITSPLNRCILTAKQLTIQTAPIIVEPLISSRVSSAWSFGKSLREKKLKHKNVDFSHCQEQNLHWVVDLLMRDSSDFQHFYDEKSTQIAQKQLLILEYLKQGKSESYSSIINRVLKFKQKLFNHYTQMCDPNKKILIISHSNVLKVLTADRIDQKGKARSNYKFNHIEFLPIGEQKLIADNIVGKSIN